MLGFASWTRAGRGKTNSSASHECPYCVPVRTLEGGGERRKSGKTDLYCKGCESRFEVTLAGEVEPVIPTLAPEETTPGRRTCIALEQGRMHLENPILCRNCQHHQNIIVQLLSAYDPSGDTLDSNEEEEEEEEISRLTRYREDLERRYPLCVTCKGRIQERLRVIEYKVRTKRLAARSSKLERATIKTQNLGKNHVLTIIDVFFVQSLFSAVLALEVLKEKGYNLPQTIDIPSLLRPLIFDPRTWYILCALATVGTMTNNLTSLLPCSWALFLLFLRVTMINLIVDRTVAHMTITFGYWSFPPYALLSLACYGLLWLLYAGGRKQREGPRKPTETASTGLISSRSSSMAASRSRISEPDVTSKLASLDTALEALGPQTPLTIRYTDLNGGGRSSPFFVPNLQPTKKTVATTPKTLVDLRPSVFDGTRQVGLESVLEGFSIDEARPRTSSSLTGAHSGSVFDKVVLTTGCFMARIAFNEQLALIAVLLILSIALRNALWRQLPISARIGINALVLGRLFWIVLLFNSQLLADWPALHERMNSLEYAMDMLIIFTR